MAKKNLDKAKQNKNDEFYTQITDIEKELKHYRDHFKNKIIYCNCDDPEWSNFYIYFKLNFEFLDLKKLITTHFDYEKPTYKIEYDGKNEIKTPLSCNGDFRSPECIEILKQVDIVITNPPFSLFREYVAQLMEYNKKFLIIGNTNAISYKEIFPLIKENKLWLGISPRSMRFKTPDNSFKDVNACWFTNLSHKKRNDIIELFRKYDPEKYPKYDNYDAINIDKTADIPEDYYGVMGVPLTFLDKYNPNQFEIIKFRKGNDEKDLAINGKTPYFRILIKRKVNE